MSTDEQKADVVARLQRGVQEHEVRWAKHDAPTRHWDIGGADDAMREAATTITALEAEIERWRDRFFKMDANFDRAVARAEAAEAREAALQQRIKELEGALAGKWQDIATAPRDGSWVWLFSPSYVWDQGRPGRYKFDEGIWAEIWEFAGEDQGYEYVDGPEAPTHWQPAPSHPPTLKDSGNGSEVAR